MPPAPIDVCSVLACRCRPCYYGTMSAGHHHDGDIASGRMGLVVLLNASITVAEFVAGMISGSLALVSDAGHNLSDVLALMLGWAGERAARSRPSARFSFGLRRVEVLIALVNALSLLAIGVYIVVEAVERFRNPVEIDSGLMLAVALVGLVGNALSIVILHRHRRGSLNLRAAFLHLLFDTLSSLAVVGVGLVLLWRPWYALDLAASLVIVVLMTWSSLQVVAEALRVFLQAAPANINPEEVRSAILGVEGVRDVHGLHIWSVSSREVFLSCHVCTEKDADSDAVILGLNRMLAGRFGIEHTTIQVESSPLCKLDGNECCK